MSGTYHLHRWSVIMYGGPYTSPEASSKCLCGFRSPGNDAKKVRTSPIDKINGREITTESGSVYILEDMDPDYRSWMEQEGIEWDPECPLKFKKKVKPNET
jgi:hypothetical protein